MTSRKYTPGRVYYGPPGTKLHWKVKIRDATTPVVINGDILHALKGHRGTTVGCALSNMAVDPANASAIPHPAYLGVITKETVLLCEKKNKDDIPTHFVRYAHSYGHITESNDTGTLKKMVEEHPDLMNRQFTLRVPRKRKGDHSRTRTTSNTPRSTNRAIVQRGALARAEKAGLIGKGVAAQLTEVAKMVAPAAQ